MPKVIVADKAGSCYGVERALGLVRKVARESEGRVHTLGPLIHNGLVVEELASEGVEAVGEPEEAEAGATLVLRAHGVSPKVERRARAAGLVTVDATCPFVKKVHKAAERLERDGFQVVVVGERGHPEVEGTCGHVREALVVGMADELAGAEISRRVGVVAQTTLERVRLREVVSALVGRCEELRVVDTICEATRERQEAAAKLAGEVDAMVVVGGMASANTRHLADVCRRRCAATYQVEDERGIDPAWLAEARVVGLTAGASTPSDQIESVRSFIERGLASSLAEGVRGELRRSVVATYDDGTGEHACVTEEA